MIDNINTKRSYIIVTEVKSLIFWLKKCQKGHVKNHNKFNHKLCVPRSEDFLDNSSNFLKSVHFTIYNRVQSVFCELEPNQKS